MKPAKPSGINAQSPLGRISLPIPPDAVFANCPVHASVLIASQSIDPRAADLRAVKHDVDLLAVVPGLRVLVSAPDDADGFVHDHELDVATAAFPNRGYRARLILRYVPVPMKVPSSGGRERGIQLVRHLVVVTALHGEHFALRLLVNI